ncbi:uncharacterized protein LOC118407158 [Branchiostoma floridae]|uniref:Uncharacterized protein LOC118407158 n=1 Tax=Branchiostoma floridae TaxID=7739 RepID=A0A9J7KHK7_BRAFL|nr:uncharacterized protein LOC118407158 [Branchiostoma floridae]
MEPPHVGRKVGELAVAVLEGSQSLIALKVPISTTAPATPWEESFSSKLRLKGWSEDGYVRLFDIQNHCLGNPMSQDVELITIDSIPDDMRKEAMQADIEDKMRTMFLEEEGVHTRSKIRQLQKYDTVDGRTVTILSCSHFNQEKLIVVFEGDQENVPHVISKDFLNLQKKGIKLQSDAEIDTMIEAVGKLLQGLPGTNLQPLPVSLSLKKYIKDKLFNNVDSNGGVSSDSSLSSVPDEEACELPFHVDDEEILRANDDVKDQEDIYVSEVAKETKTGQKATSALSLRYKTKSTDTFQSSASTSKTAEELRRDNGQESYQGQSATLSSTFEASPLPVWRCPDFPWCDPDCIALMLPVFLNRLGDQSFATDADKGAIIYRKMMCLLLHAFRDCEETDCPIDKALAEGRLWSH